MKYKLKINWFGEGLEYKSLLVPKDTTEHWKAVAIQYNKPFPAIITDPFFYLKFKEKKWDSLESVPFQEKIVLQNSPKNQIEIWFKNKKVAKIKMNEILNSETLFPLYKTQEIKFELQNGIHIIQKTIGQIASYELTLDHDSITMDDFQFHFINNDNEIYLENILFKNEKLLFKKKDSSIIIQEAVEI